jgi:NAD(P)-dependent dehydrogenase (short-subunit alcohol dehydrogenase family)
MRGIEGKAILVTGSSTGIGYAMAQRLVAGGAKVLVHGNDQAEVDAACRALGAATQGVTRNLAEPATAEFLVDATMKAFGRIDGLVNNAGIYPRGVIGQTTAEFFDHVFAINTRAPLLCAEAAIRAFRRQKSGGAIVTVGSINAHCGQADLTVYSMSKGALATMTRNLADALGPEKIRVNCLNVGWTFTANEDATQQREGRKPGWQTRLSTLFAPTGQIMKPQEIAAHTAFWLSDDSAPVSGQIYEVEQYPLIGRMRLAEI